MSPQRKLLRQWPISHGKMRWSIWCALAALVCAVPGSASQAPIRTTCSTTDGCPGDRFHNVPTKPFRMIGNIYWVGLSDQTSFLITTPKGHILVDTTSEETAPWIRESIEKLGFKLKDIKFITTTHAHGPHMGGFAAFKEITGAKIVAPAGDAYLLEDGGQGDFDSGRELFRPLKPDRVVSDGQNISLGGVTLVAHVTPGHTKGCLTWTTVVEEAGKTYNVVIACPPAVGGETVPLVNNSKYPGIAEDYVKTFSVLKSLPCDVFLSSRSMIFKREEKQRRLEAGEKPNPFIDPQGYRDYIADAEKRYSDKLNHERAKLAQQKQ
jgi:metallo-beta-lactamase class B